MMPNLTAVPLKISFISLILLTFLSLGCNENSEAQKLRQYLSSINAAEVALPGAPPTGLPTLGAVASGTPGTQIIQGTPRLVKEGVCGDGVINGPTEDCDQGAIQNTTCREYGGIAGEVRCQPNCLYDISDCITPAVDRHIGGIAETCKCNCTASSCTGGCQPTTVGGQSICEFRCDNTCPCNCEGKLEAHIEQCIFRCACELTPAGDPRCDCSLSDCDILSTISPNIATLATAATRAR